MVSDVDVVVVGGGAAGIAAARRLRELGRSVLLVEAMARLGGRAHTVMADDMPIDLGCGWLHSATRNPLVRVAEAHAVPVDRTPSAWGEQWENRGFPVDQQQQAHTAYQRFEQRLHQTPPTSDRASDAVAPGDPWRPFLDAMSGYINGAELDRLSIADFLAYDDAATDDNWRLPDGYGSFIAGLGSKLAVKLDCQVIAIDHRDTRIQVQTTQGRITARAVIVAIPTDILARGVIRFTPAVDTHLHAAACLPLGLADKLFLRPADPRAFPIEGHLIGNPHDAGTGSYYLRPLGMPVIECFFGGVGARALEKAGGGAAEALAREELTRLLGADLVAGLSPMASTAWGRETTISGSYSHAMPGEAHQRAILARPPSPRLAFAGEACSPRDFSTCHGAWESGIAAADLVARSLPTA